MADCRNPAMAAPRCCIGGGFKVATIVSYSLIPPFGHC